MHSIFMPHWLLAESSLIVPQHGMISATRHWNFVEFRIWPVDQSMIKKPWQLPNAARVNSYYAVINEVMINPFIFLYEPCT